MDTSGLMYPKPKDAKNKLKRCKTGVKKVRDGNRYSILTNDMERCIICGRTNVNKHEIFFGNKRQLSKAYGLVIPLCQEFHHNQFENLGIHFDKELDNKWRIKGQKAFMEHYKKTKEEFREIFGVNYIK